MDPIHLLLQTKGRAVKAFAWVVTPRVKSTFVEELILSYQIVKEPVFNGSLE
jgi:hypothetical protein